MTLGKDFLDKTIEAQETNEKRQVKFNSKFLHCQENRIKSQLMEYMKIFANHMSDRELISQKYKELSLLNSKKISLFKMSKTAD